MLRAPGLVTAGVVGAGAGAVVNVLPAIAVVLTMLAAGVWRTESMGSVVELLGDGKGGFAPATSYFAPTLVNQSTDALFPADITIADMNGDAKPDVLTSNTNGNNVSVWTNDGTSALGTASNYYVGGGRPTSYSAAQLRPSGLKAGDVNGDGKLDVVTVNAGTSDISVLLGDGKGRLGPATRFADGISLGRAIALGDVSGDGTGTFRNAGPLYDTASGANGSYAVGDLNADGRPDVAAASTAAGVAAQVLLNTSKRITTGAHLNGTGGQWTGIAKPGPGGHFPQGANPQPGTSLSPAVTTATGDGGTRGVFTHDGATAQWNIPAETVPGSYSGTLQYTITG
ncbi:VCBS repeat-containing protein [Streptomyces wedmorensis]|uniref:FG-GAP repeat domain-containing protein n=1 Tax=Streptomyces wedmorensis TaxID=43759 RepID=UPI00342A171E